MAQLVALMSGVVLGGVAEVVGSNPARQHLSAQLIHYIPLYVCSASHTDNSGSY